ncbi:endonuclease/exonuclease/phosphatase family protein [Streptomyces sp. NPDC003327]
MDRVLAEAPVPPPRPTGPSGPTGPTGPSGPAVEPPPPLRPRQRPVALAAWLLLAVPAVVTGCRVLGTDATTPVPQLLSFLPWLCLPAGLALLLAAAARRRGLSLATVVVLTATGWSSLPYYPELVTSHGAPLARVRVIAANVEFGQATGALLTTVRRERPELVYVSECDRACGRALTTALADRLPHHVSVDADGSVGSVILSAYPLSETPGIPAAMGMPGATARIAGRTVRLQLAHPLPPVPGQVGAWKRELGRIEDFVGAWKSEAPLILAGDFNASQDHAAFRAVLDAGRLQDAARATGDSRTPTWPMEGPLPPFVQIDHVLVNGDFTVADTRFLDLPGSDHRAVLTDLDLRTRR